jgi:hypothetical protein
MRSLNRTSLATVALAALATLTACGSTAAPGTGPMITHPNALRAVTPLSGPPSGTRAEAAALARQLLARLILPSGARRLPQTPLPPALAGSWFAGAEVTPSLDQYELFALAQPMNAAAAFLAAHVPPGLGDGGTGGASGPGGPTLQDVTYLDHQLPAGIVSAQLVLSVVPSSGGSLLRADAQVIWYPPRTAAEYIDPARYHALTITVSVGGGRSHTVHKVVTSQPFIARLADLLNRLPAEPLGTFGCPAIFAEYQVAFSASPHSRPVVVISFNETGCGGAGITVNGRTQSALEDNGRLAALVDQMVKVTWQL